MATTTTSPVLIEGTVTRQIGPYAVAIVGGVQWLLANTDGRLTPGTSLEVMITPGTRFRVFHDAVSRVTGTMALIEGLGLVYVAPNLLPRMVDVTIRPIVQDDEADFGEGHREQTVLDSTALLPIKLRS